MAISPPRINNSPLPHASAYREFRGWRGGNIILINGAINFDLVTSQARRTFSITWLGLTTTQRNQINTAFDGLVNGGTFTPPVDDGTVPLIQVTWSDQQQELEWEATSVSGGQLLLWGTTMMLREA